MGVKIRNSFLNKGQLYFCRIYWHHVTLLYSTITNNACLLVSPWQGHRSSESSHLSRLQAHWRSAYLPERGRGGGRCSGHDQGRRGQKRGSFHCEQGELWVHNVHMRLRIMFFSHKQALELMLFVYLPCANCVLKVGFWTFALTSLSFHFIAVVHFPWEVPGEARLWEDSQWS